MSIAKVIALSMLLPVVAAAEEQACRRQADDSVVCSSEGFRMLSDALTVSAAEARRCAVVTSDADGRLSQCQSALQACDAQADGGKAKPALRRLIAMGLGMAAAAVIAVAAKADVDDEVRKSVITAAVTTAVGSMVVVAW